MSEAPTGTVTLLFTDIEGSTQLLQRVGDRYTALLQQHCDLLRAAFRAYNSYEVRTEGDSFFVVFQRAEDAVLAAVAGQRALAEHPWPEDGRIRVRMGLHTGQPTQVVDDYVGLDVHRAARISNAGNGEQILISAQTREHVAGLLPNDVILEDLGEHRLRDIIGSERIYQVSATGLAADLPPIRTLTPRPNNLPIQRGRIIGREHEAGLARRLLLNDDVGLVTLTGPAGTGKTRLALHVASHLLDHFDDGVFLGALAPITDPALVVSVIAQALGVRESPRRPLLNGLKENLRAKSLLLVLDNFEQVIEAATVVAELLATCRRLKILVTSRERLQIREERAVMVPPLPLPNPSMLPPVAELAQVPSVALFVERAMAARPDFAMTTENAAAIAGICVHLDGLPLALELAAARVKLMPPHLLQARFATPGQHARLAMLVRGPRDMPARHQTLRSAITWSYDLLPADEQALFRRLGVFVDGFDDDAVAAMAEGATDDPLEGVASLVDKSMVFENGQRVGGQRYGMLETIREYALEQLEASGAMVRARAAHANYFLEFAEQGERELQGPGQADWIRRLDADHDNLRAALDWYLTERSESEDGPRLAAALGLFWYMRNQLSGGRRWIDRALTLPGLRSASLRAKLLVGDGALVRMHNDLTRAAELLDGGAALYQQLGDDWGVAWALSHLGMVAQSQGQDARAIEVLERSVRMYRAVGDTWGLARTLVNLGCALKAQGEHIRAVEVFQEGLRLKRPLADWWGTPRALSFLADSYYELGEHARAEPLYAEALQLSRDGGDRYGVALAIEGLAAVAQARGASDRAIELLREGLVMRQSWGDSVGVAEVLQGLAALEARRGQPERGARLCGAAETVLKEAGAALSTAGRLAYERTISALQAALDPETLAAAWAAGAALSPDRAVSEALSDDEPELAPFEPTGSLVYR